MEKPRPKDYLLLHLIIVFWGFSAISGVLCSLEAPILVAYRTALSFLALLGVAAFAPQYFASSGYKNWPLILAAGSLTALHWVLFFASAKVSNVSTCLAGMATTALWTSLLEPIFTRKKFLWTELALGALVAFGLYTIYQSNFQYGKGLLISLASAVSCSLFTIFNRKLVAEHSPLKLTTIEMGIAFCFTIAFIPILSHLQLLDTSYSIWPKAGDWVHLAFLSLVCTVFAYTISIQLMRRFSAFAINLTVNLEPVYGIALGLLFFGEKEKMNENFYLGLLLILMGIFAYPILEHWQRSMPAIFRKKG